MTGFRVVVAVINILMCIMFVWMGYLEKKKSNDNVIFIVMAVYSFLNLVATAWR